MFVKPVAGGMIRWPRTFVPLRETGEHVPEDAFWLRSLSQGCIELAEAPGPDADPAEQEHDA